MMEAEEHQFRIGDYVELFNGEGSSWNGVKGIIFNIEQRSGMCDIKPDEGSFFSDGTTLPDHYKKKIGFYPRSLRLVKAFKVSTTKEDYEHNPHFGVF